MTIHSMHPILTRIEDRLEIPEEIRDDLDALRRPERLDDASFTRRLTRSVSWLHRHGEVDGARAVLDAVSEEILDLDPSSGRAATVFRLQGITRRMMGEHHAAADALMKAKVLAELLGHHTEMAKALNGLGNVYGALHLWSLAETCYARAVELARDQNLPSLVAKAGRNLTFCLIRQGRLHEAAARLRDVDASGMTDDEAVGFEVSGLLARGSVLRLLGFRRQAERILHEALERAEEHGLQRAEALVSGALGAVALDAGDPARALAHFKTELRIGLATAPEGDLVAGAYGGLAEAYSARGDVGRARNAITEGGRLAAQLRDDELRLGLLRVEAELARRAGDGDGARRHYREAASLAAQRGYRLEEAITLEMRGFAILADGDEPTARRDLDDAAHLYEVLGLGRHARRVRRGERARSRSERPVTRPGIGSPEEDWSRHGILTRSPALLGELDRMARVAPTPLPVLVVGESGVGKELVARALHTLSGRTGSLVDVNCPAIPESMLESDLFGCRKGAFTGAEDRPGLVASSHQGTLFLDEVGDLPLPLQAKLLRFLETGSYRRVGGTRAHGVDTRLVSATNRLLEPGDDDHLRSDLFHRIAGVTLRLPPLRERPEDVELLARHILAGVQASTGVELVLEEAALDALVRYRWPGNVRELRHTLQAVAFCADGARIRVGDLPPVITTREREPGPATLGAEEVREAFRASGGRLAGAARALGLSRQQLYRRLDDLGLDRDELRDAD